MRKTARTTRSPALRNGQLMEAMEPRILLTTLSTPGSYQFVDASSKLFTVTLTGNITAELYASDGSNLIDLVTEGQLASGPPAVTGKDVFAIYITSSDINSKLTITSGFKPPNSTGGGTGGDIYTGNVATLFSGTGGGGGTNSVTVPAGSGQIFLGEYKSSGMSATPTITAGPGVITPAAAAVATSLGGYVNGSYISGIYSADSVGTVAIDGTVTGQVKIDGSIGTFYSGWLVTGDAARSGLLLPDNFFVNGDIGNLLVRTSVGTQVNAVPANGLDYDTGVQIHAKGKIGSVRVGGALVGSVTADNATPAKRLSALGYSAVEPTAWLQAQNPNAATRIAAFSTGILPILTAADPFANNTFATATYVGALNLAANPKGFSINGTLQGLNNGGLGPNPVDNYAVGVEAGQTVSVVLWAPEGELAVFDPDGRLIITQDVTSSQTMLGFKADKAGAYRIAVALPLDRDADGAPGLAPLPGEFTYGLAIGGLPNTAIGGVNVDGDILTEGSGISATTGNVGAIHTAARFLGGASTDISAINGGLESLEANSIGINNAGLLQNYPSIHVDRKIGLISATGDVSVAATAGGDIQIINSGGDLEGEFQSNRAIGVVRAASILGNVSVTDLFSADADNTGNDGIIELIDVTGDMGSLALGGPRLMTGTGGDVRFIHVGGSIYQDPFFSGGIENTGGIDWGVGQKATLTDDSGAALTITPTSTGQLTTTTYGVFGSGGVAIVNIQADSPISIVASGSGSALQRADIGEINITGSGAPLINGAPTLNGSTLSLPRNNPNAPASSLNILAISGSFPTDVFLVSGSGLLNSLSNSTGGDVVNINFDGDIGGIDVAGNLGSTFTHTGATLNQSAVVANSFPFFQQHIGIVADNLGTVKARSIGNINASGNIGAVVAGFGGITGPVVAGGTNLTIPSTSAGDIGPVIIGGGLTESGSVASGLGVVYGAQMSFGGLYATGGIYSVTGSNADIRGDIISQTAIGPINLWNGSVVGSQIGVYTSLDMASFLSTGIVATESGDTFNNPSYEVTGIHVMGNGGVLGSVVRASDIGPINVDATGFGILGSSFVEPAGGVTNSLIAGGFGVRNVFDSGARINSINATGNGSMMSVNGYNARVRGSQTGGLDPQTGRAYTVENDLALFMANPNLGMRDYRTGIVGNSRFIGAQNLGSLTAFGLNETPNSGLNNIAFANNIGVISIRGNANALRVTTGSLGMLHVGQNVSNLNLQVAGPITNALIGGSFTSGLIYAKGPSSSIGTLFVGGNLGGTVQSEGQLSQLKLGYGRGTGAFTGVMKLTGGIGAPLTFNSAFRGALQLNGYVPGITFGQGMAPGSFLTVVGNLQNLTSNGNLSGILTVSGNGGTIHGTGTMNGRVTFGGHLGSLTWSGNFASPASVIAKSMGTLVATGKLTGRVSIDGSLQRVVGGNASALKLTAGTGIGPVTIVGALTNSVIQSGITAGNDRVFGTNDANEASKYAWIGAIKVGSMTNSVIGAGGGIASLRVTGRMVDSSVSSAMVVNGDRLQEAIAGANQLNSVGAVAQLREGATTGPSGNFGPAVVNRGSAAGLDANSWLTAGISPGADGIFGTVDDVSNGVSRFVVRPVQTTHVLSAR
jgi:hypothetical protein